jgi:hypothetical protein
MTPKRVLELPMQYRGHIFYLKKNKEEKYCSSEKKKKKKKLEQVYYLSKKMNFICALVIEGSHR